MGKGIFQNGGPGVPFPPFPLARVPTRDPSFSPFFNLVLQAQNSRKFFFGLRPETAAGAVSKPIVFGFPANPSAFSIAFSIQKKTKTQN